MPQLERYQTKFELKFVGDADAMTLSGYGAVFGNTDSYGDVIEKGAFAATLKAAKKTNTWPAMLLQHGGGFFGGGAEDMTPVGIWTSMKEDDTGLLVEGKLAPTQRGRDIYELMKMEPRPAINGLSIGYIPREWTSGNGKDDEPRRTLKKVDLIEVSIVTFPANAEARVGSVKAADDIKTIREFEAYLRDACGFSSQQAKAIASGGWKAGLGLRDAGNGLEGRADDVAALQQLADRIKAVSA